MKKPSLLLTILLSFLFAANLNAQTNEAFYAGKWKIFQKHWGTHTKYCLPEYTHDGYDHTKFLDLWKQGSNLISCIPGYSTHVEGNMLSPTINWSQL